MDKFAMKLIFCLTLMFFVGLSLTTNDSVFAKQCKLDSDERFFYEDINDDIKKLMEGKSYKENEYIRWEDLKLCQVMHFGFDNQDHVGQLVVANEVAQEVLEIFKELYDSKYPIEKIELIDYYDASDDKSMRNNNSSAFNFRYIMGTNKISWHSYGLAIDINPIQNPCHNKDKGIVEPETEEAKKYCDRNIEAVGLIKKGDPCHKAFTSRGWEWGGSWSSPIDYMHFQKYSWKHPKPAAKYNKKH